ncbi:MAG TPA: GAF domain-containing protein, partial [Candidatus Limnocylindrales bacterium]|nr:GAF domain-containing protein [Candidatus Limnocylindrales bacterium]
MSRHPRSLIERAVQDGDERSVSRGRVVVACLAALLVAATTLELLLPPADLGELVRAVVAGALVAALVAHDQVERRLALRRAAEAEGFTRILQGLSRSVSPEAVVAAIVEELRVTSGADHIVVARLRPEERVVEATLVSAGAGTPASTTRFPATLLEPEGRGLSRAPVPVMADAVRPLATIGPAASGRLAVGTAETAGLAVAQAQGMAPAPGTAETAGLAVAQAQGMAPAPGTAAAPGTPATAPAGALPVSAGAGAGRAVTAAATTEQAAALEIAERIAERVGVAYGLRHTLAAPLQADRRTVGALVLSRRTGEPWTVGSRRLLEAAAQEVSAALERAYAHAEAEAGAKLDALTGLPNRRHFDELATLLAHGRRE